jgi:sigma-B regulation protein RsbU (phosphoserine phosphatase)
VAVIGELNRLLFNDLSRAMFVTLFYAVLDLKKKHMLFTSAGHNPGLIWRAQRREVETLTLEPTCLPLGVDNSPIFGRLLQEKKVALHSQDVILLYTDGVTEALNESQQEFGLARLQASLAAYASSRDADTIIQGIDHDISRFCGQAYQNDDIAMVAVRVE